MLARLNPFRGLPNPRTVWAWGMYDLANQSFTLLILTLLFPIYFKEVAVGGDPARGDRLLSIAVSISLLVVVISSPIVGAIADLRHARKRMLLGTGMVCVALTSALALVTPGAWLLAMLIFIPANIAYQLGENFLASFLPIVSTSRNIGRISATGWTMGYIGALLLLGLTAVQMQLFGWGAVEHWRPFFVFAGVWFLLGMAAPAIALREPPRAEHEAPIPSIAASIRMGFARVAATAKEARKYKQLVRFLIAFFIYAMGVQTMIVFAAILASDFGFKQMQLVLFVLQLTVTAGAGAIVTGFIIGRIGAKTTVLIFLGVWVITCAGMTTLTIPANPPTWMFWVVGNGVGLGLGGIGASSRAMVGRFTPKANTAEFFGLWGMAYKGAGVFGVLAFGQVKASMGSTASLVLLTLFFLVGGVVALTVNETRGVRAARRAERGLH